MVFLYQCRNPRRNIKHGCKIKRNILLLLSLVLYILKHVKGQQLIQMFRVISRCIKTKNMWQETIILYVIVTNKQLWQHIKFLPCSSFVSAPRCIPWPWCASESVTFINPVRSFVSTSVRVIKISPSTKPDSGVTFYAIPLIASNDADSCFGITSVFAHGVKPLLVTLIELQGGLRTNRQRFNEVLRFAHQ